MQFNGQYSQGARGGKLKLKNRAVKKKPANPKKPSESKIGADSHVDPVEGAGTLVTTGNHVHGFDTAFLDICKPGDGLLVFHPKTLVIESRVIVAVLSQRSLTVNEGFPDDIFTKTKYHVRQDHLMEEVDKEKFDSALTSRVNKAESTYTYREKLTWGYKTVTMQADHFLSAEEKLNHREKLQGRDKHCR
ncbi:MAG: uncharacterized protein KVP18_004938 [Porospora cf. gigantea A]|uniref:uncharacterized protein n=1 Tax=Porospora cf. gigantea A TaxID=2853593 RepID=UPI003559D6D2|nr:MAG: hypothetical protein KVP18_004938 [Porospora cf. gigantea A]